MLLDSFALSMLARRYHRTGLSLMRIAYGTIATGALLFAWPERRFLWGTHAAVSFDQLRADGAATHWPSLYVYVRGDAAFDTLYALTILAALSLALGFFSRASAAVLFILGLSLANRNLLLGDGGTQMLVVMLPWLALVDAKRFSLDERLRPARPERPLTTLAHNLALGAIVAQLCIAYVAAGAWKLSTAEWRDGSAIHYALVDPEFSTNGLGLGIANVPWLDRLLAYGTTGFQLVFPLLLWTRATRLLAAATALSFHIPIGILMTLMVFSAIMIASEFAVLADDDYVWLAGRLRAMVRAVPMIKGKAQSCTPSANATVAGSDRS